MKTKLIILLSLLYFNITGQTYDIYRVIAYSNDSIEVISVSNTIRVLVKQTLYVPNVFSPDGDGINDLFFVKGNGLDHITIEIYNRWGQMIFEAPHLNERWDGTFRGKPCPMGTYVYQLLLDNEKITSGTVTLVR